MSEVMFESKLRKINSWLILRLPDEASKKLSSRGMVMVEAELESSLEPSIESSRGKVKLKLPLEPDGSGGHWFKFSSEMQKELKASDGDLIKVKFKQIADWLEPEVPKDLKDSLDGNPKVNELWLDITVKARWEFICWIRSTANPETRKRRIEVSISKLNSGMRRPCCFNTSMCTEPEVCKNGVLLSLD